MEHMFELFETGKQHSNCKPASFVDKTDIITVGRCPLQARDRSVSGGHFAVCSALLSELCRAEAHLHRAQGCHNMRIEQTNYLQEPGNSVGEDSQSTG